MEPIISVVYHRRALQFEQSAYNAFQAYEQRLKNHFEKIESGLEAFDDLQYRMAEILESFNKEKPITAEDVHQLIRQIGEPADLVDDDTPVQPEQESIKGDEATPSEAGTEKKWSFFKSKNEKVLGGVCAGLAQTFAIDPIAVRLMFVLVTLLQVATLFTVNMGVLAYILLWIFLPSKLTRSPIGRKFFRDPQFRILGGVCAGLAKLFSVEKWMIRILFLAPFLLEAFDIFKVEDIMDGIWSTSVSFNGISFIVYLVLWIITPLAKSGTDFMLLNGDPVNLSTIQQVGKIEQANVQQAGIGTKLFRFLAYVVMAFLILMLVPFVFSMGLGTFLAYRASDFILFSTLHKSLAFLVIVLVFILPFLVLLFGLIRRLAGYAKPNPMFRKTLLGLHVLGWVAAIILVYSMLQQHHAISSKKQDYTFTPIQDTLRVYPMEQDTMQTLDLFSVSAPNSLIQASGNQYVCRTVWVNFHRSADSLIRVRVIRRATGSSEADAGKEIERFNIIPTYQNGALYLPRRFTLTNQSAYHFQHAQLDVYVPEHIVVRADKGFKNRVKSLNIGFSTSGNGILVEEMDLDSVFRMQDVFDEAVEDELDGTTRKQLDSLRLIRKRLKQEKGKMLDSLDRAIDALQERF